MAPFSDCLKLAKFFARYQKRPSIDLPSLRCAMAFYQAGETLESLFKGGMPEAGPALLQWGPLLLAAYEVSPMLALSDDAKALRKEVEALGPVSLDERFSANAKVDPLQVKVVRRLAAQLEVADMDTSMQEFARQLIADLATLPLSTDTAEAAPAPATPDAQAAPPTLAPTPHILAPAPQAQANQVAQGLSCDPEVQAVEDALGHKLLDQPLAVRELTEELQARAWGLATADTPAIFLLIGPPGCGKTLLGNMLAEAMPKRARIVINMATFTNRNEGFGLTGLRFGYDSAAAGRLTSFVRDNPQAIVVLENFDRAHPAVQELLIPLFTEAVLSDEFGFGEGARKGLPQERKVSFRQSLVLLTTTQCAKVYERRDYLKLYEQEPDALVALLQEEIARDAGAARPPELAQGLGQQAVSGGALAGYLGQCRILPFRALGLPALETIALHSVETFQQRLASKGLEVQIADRQALAQALTLSQGPDINPKELENIATRALLGAFMQDAGAHTAAASRVVIHVGDAQGLLQALRAQAPEKVKADLFRRSQRLQTELRAARGDDAQLTLSVNALRLERVPLTKDYGGEGGVTIEMPVLKFQDVFGHTYIKDRLQEVVRLLKQADTGGANAISMPRGMLLFGRPGTGKTMLAKALAAEADLPFIAITGPQLLNVEVIKSVFRRARQYAPSLVFMDEIDALGVRGRGGNDACVNQLLTEIDGFEESRDGHIFVIAATNFPEKVDPALIRSGRLDLCLEVPMLDREARRHFIERLASLPHLQDWNADALVELSAGMTGADLEKLCREATLDLIRRPRSALSQADLLELLNAIKHGARVERPPLKEQLASTAYHEAGHAVVSLALNPDVRIEQVTIVPRRDALGFTAYTEESMASRHFNRQEVMGLICVALAGRMAESRQFPAAGALGGPDAGASSDLARASALAWRAITEWGLDETFGWVSLQPWQEHAPISWRAKAAERVEAWLNEARQLCQETVEKNWLLIDALAQHLLAHEMIDGAALRLLSEREGVR